jgi:hypothetical protein
MSTVSKVAILLLLPAMYGIAQQPRPDCSRPAGDQRKEAEAISKANGRARRSGCALFVRAGTDELRFTDNPNDTAASEFVQYYYDGLLQGTTFHGVVVQLYESGEYELIGPRGHARSLGRPTVSPDRKRILATSAALQTGYVPNSVQIWNIESGFPKLELDLRSGEWAPSNARWIDANTIRFDQDSFADNGVDILTHKDAQVRRSAGGWAFEPAKRK